MSWIQAYPYMLGDCQVKFEATDGYETIGYNFEPMGDLGAYDIMGLAKKVHKYLAGLCINNIYELNKEGRLSSAFVQIDCHTRECGFDGIDFTITCDYISLCSDAHLDSRKTFKPMLYVGDACIGELFKYADED